MSSRTTHYIYDQWNRLVKVIDGPAATDRLDFHLDENRIAELDPPEASDRASPNPESDPPDEPFVTGG